MYKYPSSRPIKTFEGTENFEQFGYSLDLSVQLQNKRNVIAISSYTKDCKLEKAGALELNQGGTVQVFDITDINNTTLVTWLKSDRAYSGFGSVVKVSKPLRLYFSIFDSLLKFKDITGDGAEELFIGAQLRTDSLVPVGLGKIIYLLILN